MSDHPFKKILHNSSNNLIENHRIIKKNVVLCHGRNNKTKNGKIA